METQKASKAAASEPSSAASATAGTPLATPPPAPATLLPQKRKRPEGNESSGSGNESAEEIIKKQMKAAGKGLRTGSSSPEGGSAHTGHQKKLLRKGKGQDGADDGGPNGHSSYPPSRDGAGRNFNGQQARGRGQRPAMGEAAGADSRGGGFQQPGRGGQGFQSQGRGQFGGNSQQFGQ